MPRPSGPPGDEGCWAQHMKTALPDALSQVSSQSLVSHLQWQEEKMPVLFFFLTLLDI